MLIYWILFSLIVLLSFVNTIKKDTILSLFSFALIILLYTLVGSLRSWKVGTDTGGYIHIIPSIITQSLVTIIEFERDPVFWITIKFINVLSNTTMAYFIFVAVVFWSFSAITIRNHAGDIFIALLVFVSFRFSDFYMNAMRQGISIALIFFSIKFIFEKKVLFFLLVVYVASLFHKSAIVFFPIYFIQYINIENKRWLMPLIFIAVFVLKDYIFQYVFAGLISDSEQYSMYMNFSDNHGILYFSLYFVAFVFCYLFSLSIKNNKNFSILLNIVFVALLFQVICLTNPAFNRISIYFSQFFTLIIPLVYKHMAGKYGETKSYFFWVSFFIALYAVGGPAPGVVPYKFYWQI